ncbi:hypothetical protein GWI33_023260 [Rhynchophorus ferrugineus]|uniref:FAM21/CAPZIP domain-containing protein n=1 Tax=Rhynchophorus ferrugineus TaxID=354439 RepID=A0A834IME4_RHYFE|nr:hypothetical protein GWI33_023260 [Rhynchophorus ferrugineus]
MENDHNFSWKSNEMIENAPKWSLAGDVALLNHLKGISDFLLSETNSTSLNIDKLLNKLDIVSVKLDVTRNEFHSLRNTQFIENRVYEDDETLTSINGKIQNNIEVKEDNEMHIKEVIQKGLITINKYFDKIEVSVSDSEDEETETSYILQPKDMYSERPLPYLIGTQEWYKKWHIGLESESDSESEKQEDSYSSSNSDDEIIKDKILGSGTSSEMEFNNRINEPVAHTMLKDSSYVNVNESETSSQHDSSYTSKAPVSNINFAEQLAAKLHNINTSTINKSIQPSSYGSLFSDEPPPLNETDQTIIPNDKDDLFSSDYQTLSQKNDLFKVEPDDNQNNNILQENNSSLNIRKNITNLNQLDDNSSEEDISRIAEKRKVSINKYSHQNEKVTLPYVEDKPPEIPSECEVLSIKKKPVGGEYVFGQSPNMLSASKTFKKNILFNESSEEEFEESMNKVKSVLSNKTKAVQDSEPNKTLQLFDDDDDNDDVSITSQKHDIDLFGNNNLTNSLIPKPNPLIQKSQEVFGKTIKVNKKISLFDDDDDSFFNDISIKKTISSLPDKVGEKKTITLFESDDENKIIPLKKEALNTKSLSLFDDSDDDELFEGTNRSVITASEKSKQQSNTSNNNSSENVVKENLTADFELPIGNVNCQEPDDSICENEVKLEEEPKFEINRINQPINMSPAKGITLFDSNNSSDDELFKAKTNNDKKNFNNNESNETFDNLGVAFCKEPASVSSKNKSEQYNAPPPINLFDSNPPPDTEWDARSDSADSDRFSISDAVLDHLQSSVQPQRSSLFDNEPPSLDIISDINSSSDIVKDLKITRIDTDDFSFDPHDSSSRRLFSDIHNERQSQDIFVTKNSNENTNPSNLVPVLEDSSSKIDYITPIDSCRDLTSEPILVQRKDDLEALKDTNEEHGNSKEVGIKKILNIDCRDNTVDVSETKEEFSKNKPSPGKLKHNLNINVAALRPGARPLSKVNLVSAPIETNQNNITQSTNEQKQIGNEGNSHIIDNPNMLISLTKNRVKIPVKRRPSTRRARQEAARKSMTEFGDLGLDDNSSVVIEDNKTSELNTTTINHSISYENANIEKSIAVVPQPERVLDSSPELSNIENKAEILAKSEADSKQVEIICDTKLYLDKSNEDYKPDAKMENVKNTKRYVFDEDEDLSSDDDFFKSVNKNSKSYKKISRDKSNSNTKGLFSDKSESESDSELFGAKSNITKKSRNTPPIKKTSIFDDLDDSQSDSDLFSSKSVTSVKDPEVKKVFSERGRMAKTTQIRKLQNKEVINNDPLSALK